MLIKSFKKMDYVYKNYTKKEILWKIILSEIKYSKSRGLRLNLIE